MSQDLPLPISTNTETKLNTLNNIVAPATPEDATYGFLYKKTGSDGLFWKTQGGGETNLVNATTFELLSFGTASFDASGYPIQPPSNTRGGTGALATYGTGVYDGGFTAIGRNALANIVDLEGVGPITAVGCNAGASLTSGAASVIIGSLCAPKMQNTDISVYIGSYVAYESTGANCSENVIIGGAAVSSPGFNGNNNIGIGANCYLALTTGNFNIAIGSGAGNFLTTGTQNTIVGHLANVSSNTTSNCILIGYNAYATANNQIRIGFDNNSVSFQTNTYIDGIYGRSINAGTGTAVNIDSTGKLGTVLSSKRYKHDVKLLDDNLVNKVYDLEPVSFIMNDDIDNNINYGLIAEDVRDVIPELVVFRDGVDDDGKKSVLTVKYQYLAPLLLGTVKQLKNEVEILKADNISMKKQLADLCSV